MLVQPRGLTLRHRMRRWSSIVITLCISQFQDSHNLRQEGYVFGLDGWSVCPSVRLICMTFF